MKNIIIICVVALGMVAGCKNKKAVVIPKSGSDTVNVPEFSADSAMASITRQCAFGPRTLGSKAHEDCARYIEEVFKAAGCEVQRQEAEFTLYNGQKFRGCNIIASYKPELQERLLLCSHWDSRPWADNDPDVKNHHTPVTAANDGASGVAVMAEIARVIGRNAPNVGVDFVCFDAEDAGVPQWDTTFSGNDQDTWCLGSQYWAEHPHRSDFRFGILLDMVGGKGATFYKEIFSQHYAGSVLTLVWSAAKDAGYSSVFADKEGGGITDDHLPINRVAGIPTIDIIPYYPEAEHSFGPTWHTINDTPDNIDPNTLKAVGQTLLQVIYCY